MSDTGNNPDPDKISPPPIKLPKPDPFDTSKVKDGQSSLVRQAKANKKNKNKKKRRHPTDIYNESQKSRGSKGCGGCMAAVFLLALVVLLVVGGGAFFFMKPLISNGNELIQIKELDTVISEAPTVPTTYLSSGKVRFEASSDVEIGILAAQIEIKGDFSKTVTLRGDKVRVLEGSRFAEDLDAFAVKFVKEADVTVLGEMRGKTIK